MQCLAVGQLALKPGDKISGLRDLGFRALIVHGSSSKTQEAGMMMQWLDLGLSWGDYLVRFFLRQFSGTAKFAPDDLAKFVECEAFGARSHKPYIPVSLSSDILSHISCASASHS